MERLNTIEVKTVKSLLNRDNKPYLALLVYRSASLSNGYLPAEHLMNRKLRMNVSHSQKPPVLDTKSNFWLMSQGLGSFTSTSWRFGIDTQQERMRNRTKWNCSTVIWGGDSQRYVQEKQERYNSSSHCFAQKTRESWLLLRNNLWWPIAVRRWVAVTTNSFPLTGQLRDISSW